MPVKSLICFLICCFPVFATTYYVANAGNDSNAGTSASAPWQTVAKVNASSFAPGDFILFKRGDIFREQLMPPTSGVYGKQITYSAYGTGPNPVITGANLISEWQGGTTAAVSSSCATSCLFTSGMETASFSDWTSVYSPAKDGTLVTQSTSIVHSGSHSLQIKAGSYDNRGGLTKTFSPYGSEDIRYFRFYMYVPVGALKPNDRFIIFQVPEGSTNLALYTNGSGNVSDLQYYANGGSIAPETGITFWMGAWNRFDVAFKVGTSDGGGQVWLNGNSIGSNFKLNTSSSAGVASLLLGNDSYGQGQQPGASIYFDDFAIATAGPIGSLLASVSAGVTISPANGIWSAALPIQPNVVFIAGNLGVQMSSSEQLTAAGQWSWSQGTLYVYSATGVPSNVEAAQRGYGLALGSNGYGSYVTVSGIDFRIALADVVQIVNTTGDVINDGLITGAGQYGLLAIGIQGQTVSNLQVTNNTVSMNQSSGIEISAGHSSVTVEGNTVFGNAFNTSYTGDYIEMGGINFLSNPGVASYDYVANNVSNNNGVFNGNESQGSGIWFDTINNSVMQNNVSFNNAAFGLYFEKTNYSTMSGNVAYSNGYVPDSANIAVYASQTLPSSGNSISGNTAWNSHNWGMKVGAYEGAGTSYVFNNSYVNNVILDSQDLDLYADNGADNDGIYGYGNVYSGNAFGIPTPSRWLYWVTYGFIANYSQLDSAYGAPTYSYQSNYSLTVGGQERCTGYCLFSSGMETSGFSDWSSVFKPATDGTRVTQSNSLVNSGMHALQITGGGTDNRGGLSAAFPVFGNEGLRYFRFYMYTPAGGLKANDSFIVFEVPAGGTNITLNTDTNGNITTLSFVATGGTILYQAPISFAMGTWNYFDIAFRASAGDGGGEVWLNGTFVGGNFGLNTSSSAGVSSVLLGNDSYGHGQVPGGNIYFDDFKIATAGPIGAAPVTLPLPQ